MSFRHFVQKTLITMLNLEMSIGIKLYKQNIIKQQKIKQWKV